MFSVSAAAFEETNPDLAKALFNATGTIDGSKLAANQLVIAALAVPVNPSDCLQIAGSYKTPIIRQHVGQDHNAKKVAIGGNEGCFRVAAVGSDVRDYKVGDWVILKLTSFGTWRSHAIVEITPENPDPLIVVSHDGDDLLSLDEAATISTNPCTAYQLFHSYVSDWHEGDWIVMNAGNSFVNKYLYQLTRHHGVRTLGIIRERKDFDDVAAELMQLGATKIITEAEFVESLFPTEKLPLIIGDGKVRLAFDSVSGPTTPNLVASLAPNCTFVNYGASSGQMVQFSPAVQLAKNITLKSYWLTRNTRENPQSKVDTVNKLLQLFHDKVFQPVKFTHVEWDGKAAVRDAFVKAIDNSKQGKQVVTFPSNYPK